MHRIGLAAFAAAALFVTCAPAALAADGDLDATFGNPATPGYRADHFDLGGSIGSFADGLALGAGDAPFVTSFASDAAGRGQFTTTKYLPNGSAFDTSFNTTGIRRDQRGFGANPFSDAGDHLVIAPDGTIVVPGEAVDDGAPILAEADIQRYTATGGLATGFGGGGVRSNLSLFAPAHRSAFTDAVALPDGSVVAVGSDAQTATRSETLVAKYTPAGILDTSFAVPTGVLHQQLGHGTDDSFWERIAMQPDGELVLFGQSSGSTNGIVSLVQRLNANGTPDPSFGTAGLVKIQRSTLTPATETKTVADGLALGPDGSIYLGASVSDFMLGVDDDTFKVGVTKLMPNGTPDPTFGTAGTILQQFGVTPPGGHADSSIRDIALAPDGKIVAVGAATDGTDKEHTLVVRFLASGSPDPSFGGGGAVMHEFADPASTTNLSNAFAVAVASTGAILIAGNAPDAAGKARTLLARFVGNTGPTAAIAPVADTPEGAAVTLDAGGSSDPDGAIVSYTWDLNGDGTFGDATGKQYSGPFATGPHTVSVKVADVYGLTATASTSFTVIAKPAAKPAAKPGMIGTLPATGSISGSTASIVLTCKSGSACKGAIALSSVSGIHATSAKAKHKAKPRKAVSYGRGTFSIAAGGHKTIKIHLTAAARKALKHHTSLKAWMIVTTKAGALSRSSHKIITLRVHRTTPKHKSSHKKH